MGRIIAFLNRKGGVGKTSTVHHLGGSLARRGLRVLLADLDPQASLTQGLLGPVAARGLRGHETVASLLGGEGDGDAARIIRPLDVVPGLHLLPGSPHLDRLNLPEPWTLGADQFLLRDALGEVRDDFDAILVDCPPHAYLAAWAALVAADGVVVPLQAEDYGALGVGAIGQTIGHVRSVANPRLRLLGYLLTMHQPRLAVHSGYHADLVALYGDRVFNVQIPLAKDYKEAVMLRQPVAVYKPRSAAAKAVDSLAVEVLERLEQAEQGAQAAA